MTAIAVLKRPADSKLDRLAEDILSKARRHLEELLEAAVNFARSRGVKLVPILREGHPAQTIVACAEEEKIELLMLGKHNSQPDQPGLGGTADQITSHAPCAVMVVK